MSDIEIHHLGAAYALDALDDRERAAYEAHYSTCEICRTDVGEFRQAAAALGSLTTSAPPAHLKDRVMAEVATTRQLSPLPPTVARLADRRPSRTLTAVLSVAAAAVLFLAGAFVLGRGSDDRFGDELAALMDEPDVQIVKLRGDTPGTFTVMWAGDRAAVIGDDLRSPGDGKAYELWLIDDSGSHAVDMLDPADDGRIERVIPVEGRPAAWGVTIEDGQGSDVPTPPVIFLAEV
jgi:anti-sigma-K factor RskA